jgi:hypothetical protein
MPSIIDHHTHSQINKCLKHKIFKRKTLVLFQVLEYIFWSSNHFKPFFLSWGSTRDTLADARLCLIFVFLLRFVIWNNQDPLPRIITSKI